MPKKKPTGVRRSFTPEFKRDAVRLAQEGETLAEVALIPLARKLLTILNAMVRDGTNWAETTS